MADRAQIEGVEEAVVRIAVGIRRRVEGSRPLDDQRRHDRLTVREEATKRARGKRLIVVHEEQPLALPVQTRLDQCVAERPSVGSHPPLNLVPSGFDIEAARHWVNQE